MKTIYPLYILILFVLSSCQNHIEEVWINADGSAFIEKTIDLSEMLAFIQMGAMMSPQEDSASNAMSDLFNKEKFDTLFLIEDIIREAATEQGESYSRYWLRDQLIEATENKSVDADSMWQVFEPLLDTKIRMRFDVKKEIFDVTTILATDNINEFGMPDLTNLSALFNSESSNTDQFGSFDEDLFSDMFKFNEYDFGKNVIRINIVRPDTTKKSSGTDFDGLMETFFDEESESTLRIHVPGKIKEVNQATATIKDNVVSYVIPADRLKDTNVGIDIEIRYKPKRKYRRISPTQN